MMRSDICTGQIPEAAPAAFEFNSLHYQVTNYSLFKIYSGKFEKKMNEGRNG
jgi:hypothetical protein